MDQEKENKKKKIHVLLLALNYKKNTKWKRYSSCVFTNKVTKKTVQSKTRIAILYIIYLINLINQTSAISNSLYVVIHILAFQLQKTKSIKNDFSKKNYDLCNLNQMKNTQTHAIYFMNKTISENQFYEQNYFRKSSSLRKMISVMCGNR